MSAFGAKRTSGEAAAWFGPPRMTQRGHRPDLNPAGQRPPGASCVLWFGRQHRRGSDSAPWIPPDRFRTIQLWPKDLPAVLRQIERAAN